MARQPDPETEQIDSVNVEEEAYEMGYNACKGMDSVDEDDEKAMMNLSEGLSEMLSDGIGVNNRMPRLRALAGYDDAGHGTYQIDTEVLVDGELMRSHHVHGALVDQWRAGAYDAATGNKPNFEPMF